MWGHKDAEDMDAGRRRNSTRYKARTVSSELLIENGAKRGPSLCSIKNLTQKFQRDGGTDATYWTFWKGKQYHGNDQFLPIMFWK